MEIADRVHHFTNYRFNWYLIEDQGRLTLVDTGFAGHYRMFCRGLESIGRRVEDIDAIIITHAHADHTGMAPKIHRKSGAPIHVHGDDIKYARRPLYLPWSGLLGNAWRPYTASMLTHAVFHGLLRLPTITTATAVGGGQTLDVPGTPRIIHVPGHTRGDIVVHLPDRGVLFSGDALVTRSLLNGRDGQPQVTSRRLNTDAARAASALAALTALGTVRLLPGHGKPWDGDMDHAVTTAIDAALPERRAVR
ncbi:MAG: MBL fold metallo-hydrolase [Ilumatobacteraceae bacterium]